jgi:uncharacterized membrane protein YebE (DUF533 family)
MNASVLVQTVLSGVLGARRKPARRALRYLTGGRGNLWTSPSTLLAAAGLAWGVIETLQRSGTPTPAASSSQPGSGAGGALAPAAAAVPGAPAANPPDDALRLIRLAISAAHADGALNEHERAAILQQAASAGATDVIARELDAPMPLRELTSGVRPEEGATLYVLAFTILRADEQLTGAERVYLAQLASLLGLDPGTVAALEKDTGDRIDALGDQGQLGG